MPSIAVEILIILALMVLNGIFSMSELAIVSARKARLQQLANKGDAQARVALELANSPNQFLSTVQVGITVIGILTGAFGGATIASKISTMLQVIPFLVPYSNALGFGIVVVSIAYLSLVIGELVPKRLAMHHPEKIAAAIAVPMRLLANLSSPVVHVLSSSTDLVLRLLRIGPSTEPEVTEEEIKVLIQQGTEAGTFEEVEQDMVERVFRLGDRRVSALMTPRPDIVWLDLEDSHEETQKQIIESVHSRFPVCQEGLDNVLGVVHVNDLLSRVLSGHPINLVESLHQPLFIPESTRALKVLELFKQASTYIALVVDEYGVIQGLVTLNDILEAIIGDIPSIDSQEEPQAIQREDGSWLLDGMLSIDEFKEIFEIEEIPGEEKGNYHTLGGLVILHLGRIPIAADHFEWGGLRFEVMDMDGNRVDKVLVMPVAPSAVQQSLDSSSPASSSS
ncbi:MAG: hemolysin family protein [Leptolyngbyaceae bacterium]|nr:hemolysin family protein [Leptolyngbyaceae bacterium]